MTAPGPILKAFEDETILSFGGKSHRESDLCYIDSKMWAFTLTL